MNIYHLIDSDGNIISQMNNAPSILAARYAFAHHLWPNRPAKISRKHSDLTFTDGETFTIVIANG